MSRRSESSGPAVPLIGVTAYREPTRWGVWDTVADVLHAQYADALLAAGGVPVLLPPVSGADDVAATVVHRIADGRLAEKWSNKDVLGFLQQLEVIPRLEGG